jgi:hypothetical protein
MSGSLRSPVEDWRSWNSAATNSFQFIKKLAPAPSGELAPEPSGKVIVSKQQNNQGQGVSFRLVPK